MNIFKEEGNWVATCYLTEADIQRLQRWFTTQNRYLEPKQRQRVKSLKWWNKLKQRSVTWLRIVCTYHRHKIRKNPINMVNSLSGNWIPLPLPGTGCIECKDTRLYWYRKWAVSQLHCEFASKSVLSYLGMEYVGPHCGEWICIESVKWRLHTERDSDFLKHKGNKPVRLFLNYHDHTIGMTTNLVQINESDDCFQILDGEWECQRIVNDVSWNPRHYINRDCT